MFPSGAAHEDRPMFFEEIERMHPISSMEEYDDFWDDDDEKIFSR